MAHQSLVEVLSSIKDFRNNQGQRYSLISILTLACASMLCGYQSFRAMSEWGKNYGHSFCAQLGFRGSTPCAATFHNVFKHLEAEAFEKALSRWAHQFFESEALAIDGKTLRGSRKQGATGSHLLSAVSHHLGVTIGQQAVDEKTNEIPMMLPLLESLMITGCTLTMDALLTQATIAETIVESQNHYVMIVKDNQASLKEEIQTLFELAPDLNTSQEQTTDKAHGRLEERDLQTSSAQNIRRQWPGAQQVFQVHRQTLLTKQNRTRGETVYGITSLPIEQADAQAILSLVRGHWCIENRSHWVRDVTFNEDRSQIRSGSAHQIMAALRNAVIGMMRVHGHQNIAKTIRFFAAQPQLALNLMGCKKN